jgi:hypothetical protein
MLLLRLILGISSECQHATPTPTPQKLFFWNCQYCRKGELFFSFDLARLFLKVPTCHPYTIELFSICHNFVKETDIAPGALCFYLFRVFLQDATMPPLHHRKFFGSVINVGKREI